MLNFSGTDTIDKLIASIQALPDQTKEVDESFIKPAKELAMAQRYFLF